MSRENVELVRRLQPTDVDFVEAFGANAVPADRLLNTDPDLYDSDLEVCWVAGDPTVRMERRGLEGLIDGWRDWLAPWASYRVEMEEILDAGDKVVTLIRVEGRTARDDVLVKHTAAGVWTIREGKVIALRFDLDRDEAMRAAGLKDPVVTDDS